MHADMHIRARDGFALPVALIAMMVIGVAVTGGFYASTRDHRVGMSTDPGAQALYVAGYGLDHVLGTWVRDSVLHAIAGTADGIAPDPAPVTASTSLLGHCTLRVQPLGEGQALVRSLEAVEESGARATREVGLIVRTTSARLPYRSAMTVHGTLQATRGTRIRGEDASGPGCPARAAGADVAAPDTLRLDCPTARGITGDPPTVVAAAMRPADLTDFGIVMPKVLIVSADRVYEPGASVRGIAPVRASRADGGTYCNTDIRENRGAEGSEPCGDFLPIVHARGDLTLEAGDGELDSDASLFQLSTCRVQRAFDASLRVRPLAARSWLDLSDPRTPSDLS